MRKWKTSPRSPQSVCWRSLRFARIGSVYGTWTRRAACRICGLFGSRQFQDRCPPQRSGLFLNVREAQRELRAQCPLPRKHPGRCRQPPLLLSPVLSTACRSRANGGFSERIRKQRFRAACSPFPWQWRVNAGNRSCLVTCISIHVVHCLRADRGLAVGDLELKWSRRYVTLALAGKRLARGRGYASKELEYAWTFQRGAAQRGGVAQPDCGANARVNMGAMH
jgi:hypothetical protein